MKEIENIVLTSRIRLARNLAGVPFPHIISEERSEQIISEIQAAVMNSELNVEEDFTLIRLKELNPFKRLSLVENHLISKEHANNYKNAAVLINKTNDISIMINEEDHIRLQVIGNEFDIKKIHELANKIDDVIEDKVTYAYDSKLGYLTSCPTNIGTGIRASVMLHLPALTLIKNIDNIIDTVNQVGITIRGYYGEGSNSMGNIYQISNQITLGLSEEEIINNIIGVSKKIIDNENSARNILMKKQALEIEDDIFRSLGMLKYTRVITSTECLNLLSKVRLGIEMGILNEFDIRDIDDLFSKVQPATLQLSLGQELDGRSRDIERARIVREMLD